jgi:AraC-like DNA-binding protein
VVFLDALFVGSLYLLAWFGLRERGARRIEAEAPSASPSYARSGLAADQCATVAAELSRLMVDEALYADSAFDLAALSRRSGWPPNYVSQALNQGLGRNFFEFVNGFRVAAAERHLADPDDARTILEIALACGFGSKSTFNAVFKRMTGRTPREFRRASEALREKPAV